MEIEIRSFDRAQSVNAFRCGQSSIDRWLRTNAKKRTDRFEFRVFTANEVEKARIIGFYALQLGSESLAAFDDQPDDWTKNYTSFPAVHLAYVAVDQAFQGRGVGKALLSDVLYKTYKISDYAGFYALTLQSISARTTKFYEALGFERYGGSLETPKMMITVRTIRELVEA